ncbi:hypothetical protein Hdeb2414_s0453g00897061 [Helianthus debilis subsp. tardiflorus]
MNFFYKIAVIQRLLFEIKDQQPRLWGVGLDQPSPRGRCGGPAPGQAGHQAAPIPSSLMKITPTTSDQVNATLEDIRLSGKTIGGSSEKSEPNASVELNLCN